jgi:magnesium transporter
MLAFRTPIERDTFGAPVVRPDPHLVTAAPDVDALVYAPALSFPQHATAQQVIETLRQMRPDAESVYYLFVTDPDGRLCGVASLREVVVAAPDTALEAIMCREVIALPADLPLEEQARILSDSGLIALPVVDAEGRLMGALDASDLLDSVAEEATEDMYRLAGVNKDEEVTRPLALAARDRAFWLMINTATAFLAAFVVSNFESVIAQAAVLAAFMPVVAGQGGNAGTQTLTFIVRSLALGEVGLRNAWRTLLRELTIGLSNGIIIGTFVGVLGMLWQGSIVLGVIIGLALLANLLLASLVGVVVPLTLRALKIDPALASSIFVTATTDTCGFLIFLGLGMTALNLGYL